jgi:hypothetical protein
MLAMHVSADAITSFRAFANEFVVCAPILPNSGQCLRLDRRAFLPVHRFHQIPAIACIWIDAPSVPCIDSTKFRLSPAFGSMRLLSHASILPKLRLSPALGSMRPLPHASILPNSGYRLRLDRCISA